MLRNMECWFERYADRILWFFIFLYVAVFSILCFAKYFSFSYYDWDFASEAVILWNSIHGHFLYYPFLEQNIFGAHLYLIILLILPVYALCQHPLSLLFLQSLFLGLAAYPLYLFARTKIPKMAALVVSVLYLLYPSVGFINLFETHFEIYEIFFIFFALYFFEKENFTKFIVFLVLAAMCKENVSFVIFMFGCYGYFRKRRLKWILTPALLGAAWFLFAVKGIIPYFAKDARLYQEGFIFSIYYKHLGATMTEMLTTIIMHPGVVVRFALTPEKIVYLFRLFAPVGFFSFFGPGPLLMTIPIFMQNLLSSGSTHAQIQYQYAGLLIPFVFASVVVALRRFWGVRGLVRYRFVFLSFLLATAITAGIYFKAPQFKLPSYFKSCELDEGARLKQEMVALIPARAPVIASFRFLPWLANRRELYSLHLVTTGYKMYTSVRYVPPDNLEYALIDFNDPLLVGSFFPPEAPENIRNFLRGRDWRVLKAFGDIVLFKKDNPDGFRLCEVVSQPVIQHPIGASLNNMIEFLGYDELEKSGKSDRILHFAYYWRRINESPLQLGFFIQFLDKQERVCATRIHMIGFRVYNPGSWPDGEVIKEYYNMLLPGELKSGTYSMRAGVFIPENGAVLNVSDASKCDKMQRIFLRDVLIE